MRIPFLIASTIPLALIAYLGLGLWDIGNPGIQYDEVLFGNASLGIQDHSFVAWTLPLGLKNIPMMLMPYMGALKAYLYFPVLRLFDANPLALRLPVILIGAISLMFYSVLAKRAIGWRGALIFSLLLATDPSFLYHTRLDWGPVALMMLLKATGVYFFIRWWDTKRALYLAFSGFCLGLGVFDKVNFVWFILASSLAVALVYWGELWKRLRSRAFAIFTLSGILGALPVILYNIAFPLVTLREPFESSGDSLIINAARKVQMIVDTLSGIAVFKFVNFDDIQPLWSSYVPFSPSDIDNGLLNAVSSALTSSPFGRGSLLLPGLLIAAVYLVIKCAYRPSTSMRLAFLALVASALMVLQLLITNKATGSHHVMMLYPLPQFLVALALVEFIPGAADRSLSAARGISLRAAGACLLIAVLLVSNLLVDVGYLRYFSAEGGKGIWSSAIYDLVDYAKETPGNRFVLMDWGFNTQLLIMSKGSIKKDEVFHWLTDGQAEQERFDAYLGDSGSLYLFHTAKYTKVARPREIFTRYINDKGLKEEVVQTFYQKNGEAIYYLSRAVPGTP